MTASWRRFLFLKLPVSVIALALLAEGAALLLRDAPLRRHPLDRLVATVTALQADHRVAVLGDSITQDVFDAYKLDLDGRVANLTANRASGIPGVLLLLRRYTATNRAPAHVVIASTPEFFGFLPRQATAETYLSTVFRRPEERSWLRDRLSDLRPPTWRPAILRVDDQLFLPLVGALMPVPSRLPGGSAELADGRPLERPGGNAISKEIALARADRSLELRPEALRLLAELCQLAASIDARLHILWAPMPASTHDKWADSGALARYRSALEGAVKGDCQPVAFTDFNSPEPYPDYAFRDPDHLRRPGWASRYAIRLRSYLQRLD